MIECESAERNFVIEMREAGRWWDIDVAASLEDALVLASGYAEHLENEERVRILDRNGKVLI